jgi:hypothetical protein
MLPVKRAFWNLRNHLAALPLECMQAEREEAALQRVAEQRGNLFAELMSAVKLASLGQLSGELYEVGGIYWRNISIGIDVGRHSCRHVPSRMLLSP